MTIEKSTNDESSNMPRSSGPSYGNFRNPLGLVYRMLTSGKRAAWSALCREALGKLAVPFDMLLSASESKKLKAATDEQLPVILVVGPPRSGTTLIYQVLGYSLDVTYPNNLGSLLPRSPITASRMATKRRAEFQNFYGQTARMSGPNDAFHIWNRWLGSDRYTARTDLSDAEVEEMQRFFEAWTVAHEKPFLNKNNRNAECAGMLAEHLPSSYFVAVRRDPVCVARSLIKAREVVQGDKAVGWGLQCQEQHANADPLGYVHDVCDQVEKNEQSLTDQLSKIDPQRVIEITYESFCTDPNGCIRQIANRIPALSIRLEARTFGPGDFHQSTSQRLTEPEEEIIRSRFPNII